MRSTPRPLVAATGSNEGRKQKRRRAPAVEVDAAPPPPDAIGTAKRIDVLLKGYDTLRAEIIERIRIRFGLLTLTAALLAFVGFAPLEPFRLFFGVVGTLALLALWLYYGVLLKDAADQVAELEGRVNALAGGEPLLMWETRNARRPVRRLRP